MEDDYDNMPEFDYEYGMLGPASKGRVYSETERQKLEQRLRDLGLLDLDRRPRPGNVTQPGQRKSQRKRLT
jgi:hypothetical protein